VNWALESDTEADVRDNNNNNNNNNTNIPITIFVVQSSWLIMCLQCFDAVGWAAGSASGL